MWGDGSDNFQNSGILNSYQSAIESYEHLEQLLKNSESIDNLTVIYELRHCNDKINSIFAQEDMDSVFSIALFQLKQQISELIEYVDRKQKEVSAVSNSANVLFAANGITVSRIPLACAHTKLISSESHHQNDKNLNIIKNTLEKPRSTGLHEIGGLVEVKKLLKSLVILPRNQPQLFEGRNVCNSILLFGPPGTGKTQIVHALAAEASVDLHSISASDILSPFVGKTEESIQTLFKYINESNNFKILFIDEIDGLCRKRTGNEQEHSLRTKTELMCQMSKTENSRNIFIICATNCPWDVDTAILRRFQKRIYIPLPTRAERFELLQLFTKNTPIGNVSNYWTMLLDLTDGYSGSDLYNLVKNGLNIPIIELEDTKIWKLGHDGFYLPVISENFSDIVCCSLCDLPPNSVKARPFHINDLIVTAEKTSLTVSSEDVRKYEEFNNK